MIYYCKRVALMMLLSFFVGLIQKASGNAEDLSQAGPSRIVAEELEAEVLAAGTWGRWTQWNVCSVSCDTGVQVRTRVCHEEAEENVKCVGKKKISRPCIKSPCYRGNSQAAISVGEGLKANLHCSYDQSKKISQMYWLTPHGEMITRKTKNPRYVMEGAYLGIRHAEKYDTGTYKCVVVRPHGKTKTGDATLEVLTCVHNNPCQNGATCIESSSSPRKPFDHLTCVCRDGYTGQYCDQKSSPILFLVITSVLLGSGLLILAICLVCHKYKRRKQTELGEGGAPGEDDEDDGGYIPWSMIKGIFNKPKLPGSSSRQSHLRRSSLRVTSQDAIYQEILQPLITVETASFDNDDTYEIPQMAPPPIPTYYREMHDENLYEIPHHFHRTNGKHDSKKKKVPTATLR